MYDVESKGRFMEDIKKDRFVHALNEMMTTGASYRVGDQAWSTIREALEASYEESRHHDNREEQGFAVRERVESTAATCNSGILGTDTSKAATEDRSDVAGMESRIAVLERTLELLRERYSCLSDKYYSAVSESDSRIASLTAENERFKKQFKSYIEVLDAGDERLRSQKNTIERLTLVTEKLTNHPTCANSSKARNKDGSVATCGLLRGHHEWCHAVVDGEDFRWHVSQDPNSWTADVGVMRSRIIEAENEAMNRALLLAGKNLTDCQSRNTELVETNRKLECEKDSISRRYTQDVMKLQDKVRMLTPIPVVSAIIKTSDERYIIGQRKTGQPFAGKWCFPGGKVEKVETLEEALRREVKEEIAARVKNLKLVHKQIVSHEYGTYLVHHFICDLDSDYGRNAFDSITDVPPSMLSEYDLIASDSVLARMLDSDARIKHIEDAFKEGVIYLKLKEIK